MRGGTRASAVPADLLVNCLLKLIVIQDCPDLPIAVTGPVRLEYLRLRLAHVGPGAVLVGVEVREVRSLTVPLLRYSASSSSCTISSQVPSGTSLLTLNTMVPPPALDSKHHRWKAVPELELEPAPVWNSLNGAATKLGEMRGHLVF